MITMSVPEGINKVLDEAGHLLDIVDGCISAQPNQVAGFLAQGYKVVDGVVFGEKVSSAPVVEVAAPAEQTAAEEAPAVEPIAETAPVEQTAE